MSQDSTVCKHFDLEKLNREKHQLLEIARANAKLGMNYWGFRNQKTEFRKFINDIIRAEDVKRDSEVSFLF